MNVDARVRAWVSLQLTGAGPRRLVGLLQAFGSAQAVLDAPRAQLQRVVPAAAARLVAAGAPPDRLAAALAWLAEPGHDLVALDDVDYPRSLLEIGDPPPLLYCLGRRELLARPAFAIVGSRNATPQGVADAEAFAAALSAAGLTIVSGLALGIDAAAHRGALTQAGSSIAVVGTGLDRVYPARNRELAHDLAARGLLVSEFAPGTPPLPANFPRRNRIISGLVRGLLVVEATLQSGSLITARLAAEQGRDVFALPGSIHSPFSKGCHRLIRDGAKLVDAAQDILEELAVPVPTPDAVAPARAESGTTGDPDTESVLAALGHSPVDVDTLVERTGRPAAAIVAALVTLELDGRAAALPGGRWQRRN
jgi:DNA processing protein